MPWVEGQRAVALKEGLDFSLSQYIPRETQVNFFYFPSSTLQFPSLIPAFYIILKNSEGSPTGLDFFITTPSPL